MSDVLAAAGTPSSDSPDKRLQVMRQLVRNIRVMWITALNPEMAVSREIRQAMAGAHALWKHLRRFRAVDPTLAEMVGRGTPHFLLPHHDDIASDLRMVTDILDEARDIAELEGDHLRAAELYEEAERFCAQGAQGAVLGEEDRERYLVLARQASRESRFLQLDGSQPPQPSVRLSVDGPAVESLRALLQVGLTVTVPGDDVSVNSPTGGMISAFVLSPPAGKGLQAPWLYAVNVVVDSIAPGGADFMNLVSGVPLALTNLADDHHHIRRLRPDVNKNNAIVSVSATFLDLRPGAYRLEAFDPLNLRTTQPKTPHPFGSLHHWKARLGETFRSWRADLRPTARHGDLPERRQSRSRPASAA